MAEEKITAVGAIKGYFGNVTMAEMRALTKTEREKLGTLAAKELGKVIDLK
jgi:hypothetical protein